MKDLKTMYGVITAMTTPFLKNGEVDFEALEEETEFLIEKGVNCLYPCGTTGEMLLMTPEQREAVAECVVKKAAGRVIVFIHVGAVREEETIRLAKHAHSIGADGIGVVTPSFFGMTDKELEEFYVRVSQSIPSDFPMYLYNIPQCSSNDIKADVAARIADRCENVVGIKYSFCDMNRTVEYLQIRGGHFSVLVGFDKLLLPCLTLGCGGTVSGVSSVFPEPFVECYNAYINGDLKRAEEIFPKMNDIVVKLKAGAHMGIFKAAQRLRGLKGGYVHAPIMDISDEEAEKLRKDLAPYL